MVSTSNGNTTEHRGSPLEYQEAISAPESTATEYTDQKNSTDEDEKILTLARKLTTHSVNLEGHTLFTAPEGGKLDPTSLDFQPRAWFKAFYEALRPNFHGTSIRDSSLAFKDLTVYGFGSETDFQKTVSSVFSSVFSVSKKLLGVDRKRRIDILQNVDGILRGGEMLAVLGPPGSGCSTLLRTLAGETHGLYTDPQSYVNYHGIRPEQMHRSSRGDAVYIAEVDDHIPSLSVGDTLYFAARARAPRDLPPGVSHHEYGELVRDALMAMFGISHTIQTRVGDDYIRGVSGGERKRVTITEAALGCAPLQCWDNSTRGLDSFNSVEFCRTLKTQGEILGITSCVAIYQSPQEAYNMFDKVTVLYEGRQIYFGPAESAKGYFEDLGFICPERQTTADFLTSMANPSERLVKPEFEDKAPRSPDEFVKSWEKSPEYQRLLQDIETYKSTYPLSPTDSDKPFKLGQNSQSKGQHSGSPYTLSYMEQVKLCIWREYRCLLNSPDAMLSQLFMYICEALIIGSIFYNMRSDTNSLFKRGVLLFYAILLNAFSSVVEIFTLYATRKVVEKHSRYALYHPSANALGSIIVALPYKIVNCILMNLAIYFMSNLRREPGAFFFYLFVNFIITLSMSTLLRFIGSITKTITQALAPASIILLALTTYTGFSIPTRYMLGWIRWLRHINPLAFGFESLMVNEFYGRVFSCSSFVPSGPEYDNIKPDQHVCSVRGSSPGSNVVLGTSYILDTFEYRHSQKWRNIGYIIATIVVLLVGYMVAVELIPSERSKGEVLVFRKHRRIRNLPSDTENPQTPGLIVERYEGFAPDITRVQNQTEVFHWQDVCYEIKVKSNTKRILDHVNGWAKPGTMTVLMGVSGAGKTTLLDVLARRVTTGIVTGDMLVSGRLRDNSFQQKTGFVQQQDLHLATSTVREALNFSALLRQPERFSNKEKLDYVDTVIDLLDMHSYADAVVGVLGKGLNVEQRKRLSIGVELAARPEFLLFLDEPTSGLDSQTSWSICTLLRKLASSGQAILCTIHQPSAMLFQCFDRLLLLAPGGKTVYFGEIGPNSRNLLDYFELMGAPPCPENANPAEYMLQAIRCGPETRPEVDWATIWQESREFQAVRAHLDELRQGSVSSTFADAKALHSGKITEFAVPFSQQCLQVTRRVFQQYWRTPSYIFSKALLLIGAALLIGFSLFRAQNSQQGLENQMFGVFLFITMTVQMIMQIIPMFVLQRTLYEAREQPSKTYCWQSFLLANISVELVWNSALSVVCFFSWYYPIGLWRNAEPTDAVDSRGTLAFLYIWAILLFASSLAYLLIAGLDSDEAASGLATILFEFLLLFCGVLSGPNELPGFWIFMYRVNPLTYIIGGLLSTTLANTAITCASNEFLTFNSAAKSTCQDYLAPYISTNGGYLLNPDNDKVGAVCQFCALSSTNTFLESISTKFSERWRNFGIIWAFIGFNIIGTVVIYWVARVPKGRQGTK